MPDNQDDPDPVSETSRLLPDTAPEDTNEGEETAADDDAHNNNAPAASVSTARGVLICVSLALLIFVLTSNVSLMTTIQGSIATEFDAVTLTSWFTSSYLIASTSLIPVAGRLSIIFTRRYYLFVSVLIVAIGLLITSQAPSFAVFLLGRVITGLGGAAIGPVALILVSDLASTHRRGLLFGCVNLCYTTGISCGAAIAGALEPVLGWRPVFWLQIPLVLFAGLLAFFALPKTVVPLNQEDGQQEEKESFLQRLSRLDFLGIITLTSSVVLLLYGLASPKILTLPIILSVLIFLLFLLVEAKWSTVDPIMPIGVLSSRGNLLTNLATIGVMSSRWAVLFYTPVAGIAIRGYSPAISGLMLVPTNVGFGVGSLLVGWLHIKRSGSFYTPVLVCFILFILSQVFLSQTVGLAAKVNFFLAILFLNGFSCGAMLNYSIAHLLHLAPPDTRAFVLSLNAMFRSLSGSFGASIAGGIFLRTLNDTLTRAFEPEHVKGKAELIRRLLGSPRVVYELQGMEHEIAIYGYTIAIRTLFTIGACTSAVMFLVQAGTGWTLPESKESQEQENANRIRRRQPPSPMLPRDAISGEGVAG